MKNTIILFCLIISGCASFKQPQCETMGSPIPIKIVFEDGRNVDEDLAQKDKEKKVWIRITVPTQYNDTKLIELSLVDEGIKNIAIPLAMYKSSDKNDTTEFSDIFLSKKWLEGQYCVRAEYDNVSNDNRYFEALKKLKL